tara:strand:+ start:812 stop:3397 length:2586 start_codon:yes stop_codon:yes gene_type:complete
MNTNSMISTSDQSNPNFIAISDELKKKKRLYDIPRKNSFKPNEFGKKKKLDIKRKTNSITELVYKAFKVKGEWSTNGNGDIKSKSGKEIMMSYISKSKIKTDKGKWTTKFTQDLKLLYLLSHKNIMKDGFIETYIKKESEISEKMLESFSEEDKRIYSGKWMKRIDAINYEDIFMKAGQGTGKSRQTVIDTLIMLIQRCKKNILVYANRQSLAGTIMEKYEDMDISEELKMDKEFMEKLNIDLDVNFYMDMSREEIKSGKSMIISPESNYKMRDEETDTLKKYDIVWLDEIRKLRMEYTQSSTLNGLRSESFDILKYQIEMCDVLYVSDADLCDEDIEWIRKMRHPRKTKQLLIWNQEKTDSTDTFIYEDRDNLDTRLLRSIEANEKVYLAYSSKEESKNSFEYLKNRFSDRKMLLITGEFADIHNETRITKTEAIRNPNKYWEKFDIVITSPCVIYGSSFDKVHFNEVYYYYTGTLTPEYTNQSIHRIRTPKNNRINLFIKEEIFNQNVEKSVEEIDDMLNGNLRVLKEMVKDVRRRKEILGYVGSKKNRDGSREINKDSLMYWMFIKSEVDRYNSMINIKEKIIQEICKNRESPVMVEVNISLLEKEKEKIEKTNYKEKEYESIAESKKLSEKEYEDMKRKQRGDKQENHILRNNYLRMKYYYDDLTPDLVRKLENIERNHSKFMRFLEGKEGRFSDLTSLKGDRMNRMRFERLLEKIGCSNGILSSEVITNEDKIKDEIEFINELRCFQKDIGMKNVYRGKKFKMSLIMNQLGKIGKHLGLITINSSIKKERGKSGFNFIIKYNITQSDEVIEVLKHLLTDVRSKERERFNMKKLELLKIQISELSDAIKEHVGKCII